MDLEIVKTKITEKRKWLRLSQVSVAKYLDVSKSVMSALESTDSKRGIELSELTKLCKLFFCTPDELLNSKPREYEANTAVNTRITNPSKQLDSNDYLELNFFSDELKKIKANNSAFKNINIKKSDTKVISLAAQQLLKEMGIEKAPVDVFDIASRMNIFVKFSVLNNLSGALIHPTSENVAGVLLNSNQPESRIRFSLAHEVAHFYLDHYPDDLSAVSMMGRHVNPIEKDADNFASEILIPNHFLENEVMNLNCSEISEIEVYKLSDKFAASYSAMLYKLRNRNFISEQQYQTYSKFRVKDIKSKIAKDEGEKNSFNADFLADIMNKYHFSFEYMNADSIRLLQEIAYQHYIATYAIQNRADEVKEVYEKVVFWLVENKDQDTKHPILEIARKTLEGFGVDFIDKTEKGGCLWVLQSKENDKVVESLKKKNIFFKFADKGGKATKKKPAWYLASK